MVYLKSLDFTTQESPSSTRWGGSTNSTVPYKIPIMEVQTTKVIPCA